MGANRKHLAMTITPNKWELDVQGYLNTCNITAATPRKQIRDFSAGVNDLGLWNSMVCWPLRSSQNYGTGTTAFSLGGLGAFNGTLVDGPTWGADGVAGDGTSAHITTEFSTNVFTDLAISSGFACGTNFRTSGAAAVTFGQAQASPSDAFVLFEWSAATNTRRTVIGNGNITATQPSPLSAAFMTMTSTSDSSLSLYSNTSLAGTTTALRTLLSSSATIPLLAYNQTGTGTTAFSPATLSIAGFVDAGLSAQNVSDLYALYKSTLGTGLGLP
jgi:hypothetical protein